MATREITWHIICRQPILPRRRPQSKAGQLDCSQAFT